MSQEEDSNRVWKKLSPMVGTCNASLVSHVYAENLIWIPKIIIYNRIYIYPQKKDFKKKVWYLDSKIAFPGWNIHIWIYMNEFMAVQYGLCIFFTTTFPESGPSSDTVPSSFSAEKAHPVPTKSIARPAISTTSVLLLLPCQRGTMIFNTG